MLGWKLPLFCWSLLPKGNLKTILLKEDETELPAYIKGSNACFLRVLSDKSSPK